MDDFRTTIRRITFTGIGAILITANVGCGTKPLPPTAAPNPPAVAADTAITPEEITTIILQRRGGPGFRDKEHVFLNRTKENAYYFHRLANALIDNGFFKLKELYPGRVRDGPGIVITVKLGSHEKVVVDDDYGSDHTYLFEMLIRGAAADIKYHERSDIYP